MQSIKNFKSGVNGNFKSGNNGNDDSVLNANLSKYDGMNEIQLLSELKKSVDTAKNNGTFSAEKLDEFVEFASSSLDEKSRARLVELVDMIKGSADN